MTALYVFIGVAAFFIVASYLIWRVTRYVSKYRSAKKQMNNFRKQINEMEQA
jgi:DMSO/TMAO reductase YedYZ heme-binding membrane subunit